MSKATSTPTTSRRLLLAGSAVAPLAAAIGLPAAAAAPHPDAELIAACAVFDALERQYQAVNFDHPWDSPELAAADAERDRISDALDPWLDRICDLRATTLKGMVARVRSLTLYAPDLLDNPGGGVDGHLVAAVMRDLLAGSAKA